MESYHVGDIVPRVGVVDGLRSASIKGARAVFLEETDQGAAAGTAVEPEGERCVLGVLSRFEEPEEHVVVGICRRPPCQPQPCRSRL